MTTKKNAGYREDDGSGDDDVIEAVGRASEALEYVQRARGHLYSFHQLIGRADFLFEEAADLLRDAGKAEAADQLMTEIVGRNVLDGRWTFQVVEEFDDLYHCEIVAAVQALEAEFQEGERHVYEARMKERRRSRHHAGHEHRPESAHDGRLEVDGPSGDAGV